MTHLASDNLDLPRPASAAVHLWMPPHRMWQYHVARAIGGVLAGSIFVGWMVIQWSNPMMRLFAGGMVLMTALITIKAIRSDIARARGRQIALSAGAMTVTTPAGATRVPLNAVSEAHWHDEPTEKIGLWLIGTGGQTLVHVDELFLADQAEARAFLQWARQREKLDFPVRWPSGA